LLFLRVFIGRLWHVRETGSGGTLTNGDHVYINRWSFGVPIPFAGRRFYRGRDPRRGELVVYDAVDPDDGAAHILVGRVAGLPGEKVHLDSGKLHINGAPLAEPASLAEQSFDSCRQAGPYGRSKSQKHSRVPEGHYFILSEDSEDGLDGRAVGWVPHRSLVGVVSTVWWPPTRWRRIRP
jgi:signal peptidase I